MAYNLEQTRAAYKKLPEAVQYLVMSNETTDIISAAIQESQFSEEQADQADSEILYAMYGLQGLDDAVQNIASLTQKPVESLNSLKSKLKENIFDKLEEIKRDFPQREESAPTAPNLPMVEPGEVAHEVPHVESQPALSSPQPTVNPTPQPASPLRPEAKSKTIHYPDGKDPYREPLD